jgi:hypothetical protein
MSVNCVDLTVQPCRLSVPSLTLALSLSPSMQLAELVENAYLAGTVYVFVCVRTRVRKNKIKKIHILKDCLHVCSCAHRFAKK